jgi:dienelactone hydrolase
MIASVGKRVVFGIAWGGLLALSYGALADEATGKVVWHDSRNASLLIECPDQGCSQIPGAKPGETYTFVVTPEVRDAVSRLKEGQAVTLVYDDGKDKGYLIRSVR